MTQQMTVKEAERIDNLPDEEREREIANNNCKAEEYKKGFAIGEALSNLSCPARKSDPMIRGFLDAIDRQHRTHQQNIFRVFYMICKMWAENKAKGWYDGRNAATVDYADRIVETLNDPPIPYI